MLICVSSICFDLVVLEARISFTGGKDVVNLLVLAHHVIGSLYHWQI